MPTDPITLRTDRLILRQWRDDDDEPWARMSADPIVMEFFPSTLDRAESDAKADQLCAEIDALGYGFWAVEAPGVAPFIGFVGIRMTTGDMPFPPTLEIGWRLDRPYWGMGFASEAAREALRFGFDQLRAESIISFTSVLNARSEAVMKRLGMVKEGEFEHPKLEEGHRLRRHVLYRIDADEFRIQGE
jgi:RimJ/RimL family protein N-acetyltransferase